VLVRGSRHDAELGDLPGEQGVGEVEWSRDVLAERQRLDSDIGVIADLLQSDGDKPVWDDVAMRSESTKALWSQWERLRLRGGVLYRTFHRTDGKIDFLQVVVPFDMCKDFFKSCH